MRVVPIDLVPATSPAPAPALVAAIITATVALTGCFPVGNYHSARTLPSGASALGINLSTTTFTTVDEEEVDENGDPVEERRTIPGIIPEFTYHIGITDDFEFGGRIAPGFLYGELDLKYRFLRNDRVHLTMAPSVGQMLLLLDVTTVRLPILFAYELHPRFAISASANVSMYIVRDSATDWDDPFTRDEFITTTGASLGVDVVFRGGIFRPSFEISRAVIGGDPTDEEDASPLQIGTLVLHFAVMRGGFFEPVPPPPIAGPTASLAPTREALSWQNRYVAADEPASH